MYTIGIQYQHFVSKHISHVFSESETPMLFVVDNITSVEDFRTQTTNFLSKDYLLDQ